MNLHEYQAKQLFREYGVPVPEHRVVDDASQTETALEQIKTSRWVIKAQVHAGGRGKAGGVKITESASEAKDIIQSMLGSRLVTFQTDSNGQPVNQVLIEEPCEIARELYLGAVIDRSSKRVTIMASTEGGMEIEKVASETPEKILRTSIQPVAGIQPWQCRQLAFGLGLKGDQIKQFSRLLAGLSRLFHEKTLA